MPSKSANVKNEKQHEALKDKGMSKERAANIANSPGASKRRKAIRKGRELPAGRTTAQHKAAGPRAGKPRQVPLNCREHSRAARRYRTPAPRGDVGRRVGRARRAELGSALREILSGLDDDRSVDHQSGLSLPGLSVNPLHPPSWLAGATPQRVGDKTGACVPPPQKARRRPPLLGRHRNGHRPGARQRAAANARGGRWRPLQRLGRRVRTGTTGLPARRTLPRETAPRPGSPESGQGRR